MLLELSSEPSSGDQPDRVHKIACGGFEPGKSFDTSKVDADVLAKGAADGLKLMHEKTNSIARVVNGWQMSTDSIGVYGNYYLKRAIRDGRTWRQSAGGRGLPVQCQ